ncbi:MbnP family protein [Sphingobacterium thalpophilum]|uniref:MbnP family protein n=1 Tax=Sphingobacterium thalpophilum TaxID=259 RepID=UPI0024A75508|nr:MbnP family protein [Sphingobacterium thalpophilum]
MKRSLYLSALLFVVIFTAAKTVKKVAGTGNVLLRFENLVDGKPLILNTGHYKNAHGDDFTVSALKYYISNISMVQQLGKKVMIPESYYLLDQGKPSSLELDLKNIPPGDYKGISFIIGVDSLRNLKGEQKGALDPAHKMYWSWKTGYIFLKLTGSSSKSPDGKIHFDVGGIKRETNTIRRQELTLPQTLHVSGNKTARIMVKADAAQLFKGKETIDFSTIYKCMGGPKAVKVADNYANGMFKIEKIQNP